MTKSTGTCGFTLWGSPPNSTMASLSAAISTTAGTPVKSCKMTLLGENGISSEFIVGDQDAIRLTSSGVTRNPSHFRNAASNNNRIVKGSESRLQIPKSCK